MINAHRSKQDWSIGNTVNVGFLKLKITGCEVIKDFLPDIYYLIDEKNGRTYEFIPHNGLTRTN